MKKKDKKHILFIVNPNAGIGGKKGIAPMIDQYLDKDKFEYNIVTSQYQGNITGLTLQAVEDKYDIVCAVGGDGTINETARSLINTNTALAIIPCGSGNGLARHLHIPMTYSKAIELINECHTDIIDYGIVNGNPFFCTCGMGFDAFISMKFAESGKRGPITYLENVLKNSLNYNPETYDIEIDDKDIEQKSYKAFLISCANASQYGNNAYIAPLASVKDGMLDITIIEPFSIVDAPSMAIQLFNGTINKNSKIRSFRCKKIKVHRKESGEIHYDGEPITTSADIEIEIKPKGLKCVCSVAEGPKEAISNIQNLLLEPFNTLINRSEIFFNTQNNN